MDNIRHKGLLFAMGWRGVSDTTCGEVQFALACSMMYHEKTCQAGQWLRLRVCSCLGEINGKRELSLGNAFRRGHAPFHSDVYRLASGLRFVVSQSYSIAGVKKVIVRKYITLRTAVGIV